MLKNGTQKCPDCGGQLVCRDLVSEMHALSTQCEWCHNWHYVSTTDE